MSPTKFRRRLRLFAGLLVVGLAIQAISLSWSSPASFLVFAGLGVSLATIGSLGFLITVVRAGDPVPEPAPEAAATPEAAKAEEPEAAKAEEPEAAAPEAEEPKAEEPKAEEPEAATEAAKPEEAAEPEAAKELEPVEEPREG